MSRAPLRLWAVVLLLCFALAYRELAASRNVHRTGLVARQILRPPGETDTDTSSTTTTPPTTTPPTTTTTTTPDTDTETTTTTPTTTITTAEPPTTTTSATSTPPTTSTPPPPTTTPPPPTTTQQSQSTTESLFESLSTSTGANGETVIVTETITPAGASGTPSPTTTQRDDDGSGINTGTIIGLSVAGGIAVLGVIAFFVWKFTRKRPTDYDDEPIKWPELNTHGENLNYAAPSARSKEAGGAAALDSASELDLPGGATQTSHYTNAAASESSANLYAPGADPYAVPPMPSMNPNQPYRDDPSAYGQAGYYDPYRGPVPATFNDAASVDSHGPGGYGGEAIPMSNLAYGAGGAAVTGRVSPGPQVAYHTMERGGTPQPAVGGRLSPGPAAAYATYGGTRSPAPVQAYGGRQSPGPGPAYGGRQSPGPGPAYGGF